MKLLKSWHIGLIALLLGAVLLRAQILVPMQSQGAFTGNDVQNLHVLKQSVDGSEVTFTLDYSYDGSGGSAARLLPVIADKNQQKVSSWFGADPVTIPAGHGTISIKVKFFNDEPGAPKELTTDRVRIMMLTDSGSSVIAQNIFSRTIKWGSPTGAPVEIAGEATAKEAAEARRIMEEKAKVDAVAKALEQARVIAEQERLAAEAKARAAAAAVEEARLKAEQERLAAEAKAKADAEAKVLEAARIKAEQEGLAAKAAAEAKAIEAARAKADQERLGVEAKAKADAEAKALEEARVKAEQERIAAEAKVAADAKAAEDARLTAEQERLAIEAKAKADAEAKALEEARIKAEQERIAAEAKAKADAEAKAFEEARVKAEKERVLAEASAKAAAEAKAKADAEAKALEAARLKAEQEQLAAEAKAKAAAAALEAARLKAEQNQLVVQPAARVSQPAQGGMPSSFVLASNFRTKVSNVDIVGRSLDRSEMTIGVDYDFSKEDGRPKMGVDFVSTDDPSVSGYFSCPVMDVGRSRHNSTLFPVKLSAAATDAFARATLPTDKIWIYLVDASGSKSYIYQETMLLLWHVPGGGKAAADAVASTQNTAQIESFRQNGLFGGYVIVKYNLLVNAGSLHLRVFDSANPSSADWFANTDVPLKPGPGMQLVKIAVPPGAKSPDIFKADTIEIQMLDEKGNILATGRKQAPMTWAKPK